jgi:mannose-6-phosphate isomerase
MFLNGRIDFDLDDNHKPEMAIAITPFDGLCGFRPLAEITHFLSSIPSLRKTVGESAASAFEAAVKGKETSENEHDIMKNKGALKTCFTALMKASPETIKSNAGELIASAEKDDDFAAGGGSSNEGSELAKVIVRLNSQFPEDIGLFVFFFLNYIKMEPGEGMFLKADDIHAYLSGGK